MLLDKKCVKSGIYYTCQRNDSENKIRQLKTSQVSGNIYSANPLHSHIYKAMVLAIAFSLSKRENSRVFRFQLCRVVSLTVKLFTRKCFRLKINP